MGVHCNSLLELLALLYSKSSPPSAADWAIPLSCSKPPSPLPPWASALLGEPLLEMWLAVVELAELVLESFEWSACWLSGLAEGVLPAFGLPLAGNGLGVELVRLGSRLGGGGSAIVAWHKKVQISRKCLQ